MANITTYALFVYYFACRYFWFNDNLKAQALGFLMLQAQPKPAGGPGQAGLGWALGPAQHITTPMLPSHTCLGPEFCTFHQICLLSSMSSSQNDQFTIAKKLDRHVRKPPSPKVLFLTHPSLMSYIQSSLLYPGHNRDNLAYTMLIVDPRNGVRVKEVFWLGPTVPPAVPT